MFKKVVSVSHEPSSTRTSSGAPIYLRRKLNGERGGRQRATAPIPPRARVRSARPGAPSNGDFVRMLIGSLDVVSSCHIVARILLPTQFPLLVALETFIHHAQLLYNCVDCANRLSGICW